MYSVVNNNNTEEILRWLTCA